MRTRKDGSAARDTAAVAARDRGAGRREAERGRGGEEDGAQHGQPCTAALPRRMRHAACHLPHLPAAEDAGGPGSEASAEARSRSSRLPRPRRAGTHAHAQPPRWSPTSPPAPSGGGGERHTAPAAAGARTAPLAASADVTEAAGGQHRKRLGGGVVARNALRSPSLLPPRRCSPMGGGVTAARRPGRWAGLSGGSGRRRHNPSGMHSAVHTLCLRCDPPPSPSGAGPRQRPTDMHDSLGFAASRGPAGRPSGHPPSLPTPLPCRFPLYLVRPSLSVLEDRARLPGRPPHPPLPRVCAFEKH